MYQHILAPIDGSLISAATVGQVVEFARTVGAKVTFFHAKPNYLATSEAALDRIIDPNSVTEKAAGEARAIIGKAEAAARGAGIVYDSVIRVSDRPFEAILHVAEELNCDLIFMSSHGHRGFMGFSLGSQTQKVLTHSRIPVLVSSIERNSRAPELDRALAVYKDEHRSIAAVVHGMTHMMQNYADVLPDLSLLRSMVHFLKTFPEVQHHPREEECLFRKLRGRDETLDALIDKLEEQHVAESQLLVDIAEALDRCREGEHLVELARAVDNFAQLTWDHMTLEDKVIIGHAQKFFSEDDWKEVAQSFAGNSAPSISGQWADEDWGKRLIQIMNQVPAE